MVRERRLLRRCDGFNSVSLQFSTIAPKDRSDGARRPRLRARGGLSLRHTVYYDSMACTVPGPPSAVSLKAARAAVRVHAAQGRVAAV